MVTTKEFVKLESGDDRTICSVKWVNGVDVMKLNFYDFLKNKMLSDCTIKVLDGKYIYGHRIILAASSRYFKVNKPTFTKFHSLKSTLQKIFMRPSSAVDPVITVPISYLNMSLIMKYAYTGEALMEESRLNSFFKAAKMLEMVGLEDNEAVQPKTPRKMRKKKKKKTRLQSSKSTAEVKPKTEPQTSKHPASDELIQGRCKRIRLESTLDYNSDWLSSDDDFLYHSSFHRSQLKRRSSDVVTPPNLKRAKLAESRESDESRCIITIDSADKLDQESDTMYDSDF